MVQSANRVIAVDWSGDRTAAHRRIWLCQVSGGEVHRLEKGRKRNEVAEFLIQEADFDPGLVVGFDFAFSFPAAFLEKRAHSEVCTVWDEVALLGEEWLAQCPFPFWGKPGKQKPPRGTPLLRRTDVAVGAETGRIPKSVFQIGGAGAVGVGSLRGMPLLRELREVGFVIWPFEIPHTSPTLPMAIEIWPRVFMGGVKKSRAQERAGFLEREYPGLERSVREKAEGSDDAFDALVSALEMDRCREEFGRLARVEEPVRLLEGEIWRPGVR